MYNIIKDEIQNKFNIEVFDSNNTIFLYSAGKDITPEILIDINNQIKKHDYIFELQNIRMAVLK